MHFRRYSFSLAGGLLASTASVAFAQADTVEAAPEPVAAEATVEGATPTARGQFYDPAYFAQYAPRNALDMVDRIPGFAISGNSNGQRGLGQATQNVLINGERLSSKSESAADRLQRISASDVVRIDIVDGTTLDIPGLSGQVANVIVISVGASGQFRYNAGFRSYNTEAQLFGGEVSLTGSSGALEYTVSLSNENNRFGADGPIFITGADDVLIERQASKFSGGFDNPALKTNFTYRFSGDTVANLNLRYGEDFYFRDEPETGFPVSGPVRTRIATVRENGPEFEIGGDLQFPLGPGQMKLIGLERFERDNFESVLIDTFDDGSRDTGNRFTQVNEFEERIGRFEYGWNMFAADWQLAGEAAFNTLDRVSGLFDLGLAGDFFAVPFPAGTGGVQEDRYEATLSISKQLTGNLAFQATAGGEYSRLEQTGSAANSRDFQRPKGSASLAWKPAADFDATLRVSREVGQLSFGDFLASVALNDDTQSGGNNNLEPSQNWTVEVEANKRFGPWGSAKLVLTRRWFEDFIDFFPLATGGEARGNIGDADVERLTGTATIKFDPIGWRGAQLDINAMISDLSVTDPFTGNLRPISNNTLEFLDIDFRHDIYQTDWAYGAGLFTNDNAPYFRRFETGKNQEGPAFLDVFVEHKDLFGLTVRATAANILGATQQFDRTVFGIGGRAGGVVRFRESFDRRIGPIFRLSVSGNF